MVVPSLRAIARPLRAGKDGVRLLWIKTAAVGKTLECLPVVRLRLRLVGAIISQGMNRRA